jgi:hypothetical protein
MLKINKAIISNFCMGVKQLLSLKKHNKLQEYKNRALGKTFRLKYEVGNLG